MVCAPDCEHQGERTSRSAKRLWTVAHTATPVLAFVKQTIILCKVARIPLDVDNLVR